MNEIKLYEFEGKALQFEQRDGDWWADAREAADALGYVDKDKVLALYKRHQREFLASETCTLKVRVQGRGGEQARVIRYFSLGGLEHLAIHGRGSRCARFRRWLLDVAKTLREGGRVVTASELEFFKQRCIDQDKRMFEMQQRHLDQQALLMAQLNSYQNVVGALTDLAGKQASANASMLSSWRHSRERIAEYRKEVEERRQRTMDFMRGDGGRLDLGDDPAGSGAEIN